MSTILGQKIGMTRIYEAGVATPVTVIHAEPNAVTQVKTVEKDGYSALQLGVGKKSPRQTRKPQDGHFKKANVDSKRFVRETRLVNGESAPENGQITVNAFQPGEMVDIIGVSKGKGFQGVMRRHNFHGQPDSHGSTMHRRPGAIGLCATPGRVFKNKPMPGRMGGERVTIQNLKIVQVREEENVLLIRGAVPGSRGSYVMVRHAVKTPKTAGGKK